MKKIVLFSVCFLLTSTICFSQKSSPDSLRLLISKTQNDTLKFQLYEHLYDFYSDKQLDSALYYATKRVQLIQQYNQPLAEAYALDNQGYYLYRQGNYSAAMKCFLKAIKISEDPKNEKRIAFLPLDTDVVKYRLRNLTIAHLDMGHIMGETGNKEQQLVQYRQAEKLAELNKDTAFNITIKESIAAIALDNNDFDAAFDIINNIKHLLSGYNDKDKIELRIITYAEGNAWLLKGDIEKAKEKFYNALQLVGTTIDLDTRVRIYFSLTDLYLLQNQKDSSMLYATMSINGLKDLGYRYSPGNRNTISRAYENLYKAYMLNNEPDSVLKYLQFTLSAKDSLNKARFDNLAKFQSLTLEEQFRLQKLEQERVNTKNRFRTYSFLSGLVVLLVIGSILYRNNRQKQNANKVLEATLSNLKSTQSQLIQSEKMASLGELTAGIAHEIQNPLNFVNNFSEVNEELLEEMKDELRNGKIDNALALADNVLENQKKINHHDKRADGIVKGMLQHSRSNSGVKEPTDINVLADEYLRLAYHGFRTKDKSLPAEASAKAGFNAKFETSFDEDIGKIEVVPQDLGRVILNLINNAFYAVTEKKKLAPEGYEPSVMVNTKRSAGSVLISVKDNGNGIPQKVLDKIFQPFFTTKPTGQATGLGLSLSYDIVKAHGGELTVETKEGVGSEFIIQLPVL